MNKNWKKERSTILFSILAFFLILVASVSFWFYRDIYNEDNFQSHVNKAISTQESRDALSSLVVEQAFKNRPVLKNAFSDQAEKALAGLLDSPRLQTISDKLILQIHDVLFAKEPKAIIIDIGNVSNTITRLSNLVESITDRQRRDIKIPDTIVLVKEGEIPSIAGIGLTLLWIGPISFLAALALFIWLLLRAESKSTVLIIMGVCLSIGSLIAILLTQWYKPIFLAMFENTYARTIAEQILNEFLRTLTNQNVLLLSVGLLFLIGGILSTQSFLKKNRS